MGIRAASNAEVALVDVKVPKENLIGREGMGYKIAMGALAGKDVSESVLSLLVLHRVH